MQSCRGSFKVRELNPKLQGQQHKTGCCWEADFSEAFSVASELVSAMTCDCVNAIITEVNSSAS